MKTNVKIITPPVYTHGGARASLIGPELDLRRSVLTYFLWEDNFYESGETIATRIAALIPKCDPLFVSMLAIEARTKMHLRHAPLFIVSEMLKHPTHKGLVSETLFHVIERADELSEFLALYWKDGKKKIAAQVKKGLRKAFTKFDAYQLGKYNQDNAIKLRDVMFLVHPKPKDQIQVETFRKLASNTLETPDTWEVALSATKGEGKKETWERLLLENKLGCLALIRNLRNFVTTGVDSSLVSAALKLSKPDRVLPFRFISAAKYGPAFQPQLEELMFKCLSAKEKLPGMTYLILDLSGSMNQSLSSKSELSRKEVACALGMLMREICEDVRVYATAGNDHTRTHATMLVPARRGFGLRDTLMASESKIGGGGIFLTQCMEAINQDVKGKVAQRVIVLTDEQDCDNRLKPEHAKLLGTNNYIINVAAHKNGIGYKKWTHIDGWSDNVIDYINELERSGN